MMRVKITALVSLFLVVGFATNVDASTCSGQGKTCLFDDALGCAITCPAQCKVTGAGCTLGFGINAVCECVSGTLSAEQLTLLGDVSLESADIGLLPSSVAFASIITLGLLVLWWRRRGGDAG